MGETSVFYLEDGPASPGSHLLGACVQAPPRDGDVPVHLGAELVPDNDADPVRPDGVLLLGAGRAGVGAKRARRLRQRLDRALLVCGVPGAAEQRELRGATDLARVVLAEPG